LETVRVGVDVALQVFKEAIIA